MTFETFTTYVTTYYTGNITYIRQLIYVYSMEAAIWALIWAASAWLLSYLNNILAQRHRRKIAVFQEYETLNNQASNAEFLMEGLDKDISIDGLKKVLKEKEARQPRQSRLVRLLSYAVTVLKVMFVLSVAVIPSVLSSGDAISVGASIGINVGLFILLELYVIKSLCPAQVKTMIDQNEYDSLKPTRFKLVNEAYSAFKFSKILFLFITVLGILYIFSVPLMTMKACLAYYEPAHAAEFGPMHISTAFSRWLSLSQSCPSGQICHIYSTLPEDTSTSVILNVHTGIDVSTLTAAYNTYADFQNTEVLPLSSLAVSIKLDIESKGARYIHSMYLNNLTANTDYYVEFMYDNMSMGKANFTTLPNSTMDKNLTMIVGGDSSGSELSVAFINQITNYDPDVILIGGDITYDNGDFDCFYCWDYYLDQFDQLNNRLGRLVPLIFAIGNHDIGQNDHQFLPVDPYANYFLLYFPQHSKPNNTDNTNTSSILPQVPLPEERSTYFYHTIGNMLFTTLDSGYIAENSGNQTTWLNTTSNQFKDYAKIALYHVPIFPACEFEPEEYNLDSRLLTWVPVFENYNYLTVFENHVHLYKRTFPLKFGPADGPGVVYVGDGAWGINLESCYDDDSDRNITGYFERMGKINHIWILNATTETLSYEAIDVGGNAIDAYSQNITDYDL